MISITWIILSSYQTTQKKQVYSWLQLYACQEIRCWTTRKQGKTENFYNSFLRSVGIVFQLDGQELLSGNPLNPRNYPPDLPP
ncbi:hypothetical protein SLEP1_g10473 [Rubroshorea leprosula]|uniref:Uncharacterized protein n=1 Tax=Rubroshorea leprosula TaxID=152421 RepID=A0AAV5IG47_9ROSI|nr:hypothetical protein SLEP1_g10473 [Rubroshorea leprosula]